MCAISQKTEAAQLKVFGDDLSAIEKLAEKYADRGSLVLPLLWMLQRKVGWISPEGMEDVSLLTGRTMTQIKEVVTFYTMYFQKPVGKYVIGGCRTLPCALVGAEGLSEYLKQKLGVDLYETTPDNKFTLIEYECLGACSEAPLMLVNETLHTQLTKQKVDKILDNLE